VRLTLSNVCVEHATRFSISSPGIIGECSGHLERCFQKKMVDAKPQERRLATKTDHGAAIVVHRKQDLNLMAQDAGHCLCEPFGRFDDLLAGRRSRCDCGSRDGRSLPRDTLE
jgi:hypothetical protein